MKALKDYKLGDTVEDKTFLNGILIRPKLVKIIYTFQDENGTIADLDLIHESYKYFAEDENQEFEDD